MNKQFALLLLFAFFLVNATYAQQFKVSYTSSAFKGLFSGHVIVYLSKTAKEPRKELYNPCSGKIVKNIGPDVAVTFDKDTASFPEAFSRIPHGTYYAQAVWDRDLGGRNIGTSPGNMYSKTIQVTFGDDVTQTIILVCDQVVPEPVFVETTYDKELKVPSKLLSAFHHKPVTVNAAVILPRQYFTETKRKFPVLFNIAGYGGDYHHYTKADGDTVPSSPFDTTDCIKVYMDGDCPLGHSVYANSDNNGPWGDALTKEFIPALEKKYRCNGAILGKGHSSGGWTVLWLQIQYPTLFCGVNASAPDPVDFRSFVRHNIYEEHSTKNVHSFENVVYRGEQEHSFDAVYGPRNKNGQIMRLYKLPGGEKDEAVLEHWKKYDISLYLRNNWDKLKNDIRDKIRISVGNEDTYALNLPVHLLEDEMKKINATITFAYYPGTHTTVATPAYRHDQDMWLEAKYQEWLAAHPEAKN